MGGVDVRPRVGSALVERDEVVKVHVPERHRLSTQSADPSVALPDGPTVDVLDAPRRVALAGGPLRRTVGRDFTNPLWVGGAPLTV